MRAIEATWDSTLGIAKRYERHISALSLAGGFAFDSWAFGSIERPETQAVFIVYLLVAGITIAILHVLESRGEDRRPSDRLRTILVFIIQFALGALLSGFCVFYIRSASVTSSWPFLLAMAAIFIGNEFLRRYHSRLVFVALLFFFSLYSYAILLVPILIRRIGQGPFLISGALAVAIFFVYMRALARLGHERYRTARAQIAVGVAVITVLINAAYVLRVVPPLPLVLTDVGIYHGAKRVNGNYQVAEEQEPPEWRALFGTYPILHVQPGSKLYLYNAVFAPRGLRARIVHDWQRLDPATRGWVSQQRIGVDIVGGRRDGYRYYTTKTVRPGQWLVKIETADGRAIGRVRFGVEEQAVPPATTLRTLR